MPCTALTSKNGKINGFICKRTNTKEKPKFCYICGKVATRLCDHRGLSVNKHVDGYGRTIKYNIASTNTWDKAMCNNCSNNVSDDIDYCNEHFNEFSA